MGRGSWNCSLDGGFELLETMILTQPMVPGFPALRTAASAICIGAVTGGGDRMAGYFWNQACDAVDRFESESATPGQVDAARPLLKVFVYCYLRGVLASSELAEFIAREPMLSALCSEGVMTTEGARRFRRRYRVELMLCLTLALESLGGEGAHRLEREACVRQATDLIAKAVRCDVMDSDD